MLLAKRHNFLLPFLVTLLVVYHGFNAKMHSIYIPEENPTPEPIKLQNARHTLAQITPFETKAIRALHYPDVSSRWIGEWGHVARFVFGEVPEKILLGTSAGKMKIHYRNELEFQFAGFDSPQEKRSLAAMVEFSEYLSQRGVNVVWLPIPTKLSQNRDDLPRTLPPESPWGGTFLNRKTRLGAENAYAVYRRIIDSSRGYAVDLFRKLGDYRKKYPAEPLYVPVDHHLSSLGIVVLADAVIDHLIKQGYSLKPLEFHQAEYRGVFYDHYLLEMLQLPKFFFDSHPELVWNEPLFQISPSQATKDIGRVVVGGSSYSYRLKDTSYGFAKEMATALNRDLVAAIVIGGGPQGSVKQLYQQGFKFLPGDIWVWEFPILSEFDFDILPQIPVTSSPREITNISKSKPDR